MSSTSQELNAFCFTIYFLTFGTFIYNQHFFIILLHFLLFIWCIFKARNHIFMLKFLHWTFFQLLKIGYLSLFTFLALTSIFKYSTQNIYIFKSVKSSSSIHNRHNRIHYRLLIYILTYIRQNVCYRSFILRTKDISN